ncbi:MAG: heme ABC exporter ATP-binding protein CcmA [Alphaproteobacteria bacterium]|nr:heme ABC exporter ATP-binding protein CcmA [Alphaproteobacteria bacterium]
MSAPGFAPPTTSSTGLAAEALACLRGERLVFERLSFSLAPGEALVLSGPNGSGKSSLLRQLAGLGPLHDGRLLWNGTPVDTDPEAHRARLAYVGHQDAVKSVLTARENLTAWASLGGGGGEDEALATMGLGALADVPARFLSAGQRRRLGLARLFLRPVPLWLLDEPTLGLDAAAQAGLKAALARHLEQRGMIALATHVPLSLARSQELDLARFSPVRAAA